MTTNIDFDPTTAATAATDDIVASIKGHGGRIVARVTNVITDRGTRTLEQTDHLVAELDRISADLVSGALTTQGSDGLHTKQPLLLGGGSAPSTGSVSEGELLLERLDRVGLNVTVLKNLGGGLGGLNDHDRKLALARLQEVAAGKADDIEDLRRQLSEAQDQLDGYRPLQHLKVSYDNLRGADKRKRLDDAQKALDGIVVGSTGSSSDAALADAQTKLADVQNSLAAHKSIVKRIKLNAKHAIGRDKGKMYLSFNKADFNDAETNAWDNA